MEEVLLIFYLRRVWQNYPIKRPIRATNLNHHQSIGSELKVIDNHYIIAAAAAAVTAPQLPHKLFHSHSGIMETNIYVWTPIRVVCFPAYTGDYAYIHIARCV